MEEKEYRIYSDESEHGVVYLRIIEDSKYQAEINLGMVRDKFSANKAHINSCQIPGIGKTEMEALDMVKEWLQKNTEISGNLELRPK